MISAQWRKVVNDVWSSKVRTLLVVLSIAAGVFAAGTLSLSYVVLLQDLDADYLASLPHEATIYTAPFGDDEVAAAARVPGVDAVEGRSAIYAKVESPSGEWLTITVFSILDLKDQKVDLVRPQAGQGTFTLGKNEILIERNGLLIVPVKPGQDITLKLDERHSRTLKVTGIVHDMNAAPAYFTRQLTAYVSPETMETLGGINNYDQMFISVAERQSDEAHVSSVAREVAKKLEKSGRPIYATVVYQPGSHPIRQIISTLLILLGGFGVLVIFLSAFLVINTINALMSQQIRQIGIMKSIGADIGQIITMYTMLVACFGLLAMAIALPLSVLAGYALMGGLANILNFNLAGFRIPASTLALEAFVALVVPVLAAFLPIIKASRVTIRQALSHYGLSKEQFGTNRIDQILEKIERLPRPVIFSLRNTFRKKARLLLTLSTLTLGGAIFITVFNVQSSFSKTIDETLGYFLSDVNIYLDRPYRNEQIQEIISGVPGVKVVESWTIFNAKLLSPDGQTSVDVLFWSPPAASKMVDPVLTAGRWLVPEDENAMVIGNHLIKKRPDLKVGDEVITEVNGKEIPWKIVGIYQMAGNVEPPFVFANAEYASRVLGVVGRSSSYRAATISPDYATEEKAGSEIKSALKTNGIDASIELGAVIRDSNARSINILVSTLLAMAVLIALVGSIGLMGTMSINVLERTREIGVLRSIGASNLSILSIVIQEGLLIGLLSWILGALMAIPLSKAFSDVIGVSFVNAPLTLVYSMDGFVTWLVMVIVLSAAASALPAVHATRLTVRDTLAYE